MVKFFLKTISLTFFFLATTIFSQEEEFTNILNDLSLKIQTVQNSKLTFTQNLVSEAPGVIKFNLVSTDSKGKVKEREYEFNLADIDINTIKPVTSKDIIQVQLIANNNQKIIKEIIDHKSISYLNRINIYASNIDNARKISNLLKKNVPVSHEIVKNRLSLNSYDDRLEWLKRNIVNVDLIERNYAQSLSLNQTDVGNVTIISTLSKSKSSKTTHYQLNLSNINPNSIFFKSNGSEFLLKLETKRRLKSIKVTEDGEHKNYINKIEIQCNSVENARDLQKVLQDIIPLANNKFNENLPKVNTVNEGFGLINEKINTITSLKLTSQQSFTPNCVSTFTKMEETSKNKNDYLYDFNLIDLNKEDIEIEIKGISIYVVIKTVAKQKFIKFSRNDALQNYTNNLVFICNSIEDAFLSQYVLKKIIGLCNESYKNKASLTSKTNALEKLQKSIQSVQLDKLTYEQKLEPVETGGENVLRFTNIEVSNKKSKNNVQEFNLSDINSKSVKIKISSKKVMVEFLTNYQEKIIKTYVGGEIKKYTNKVAIYCNTIENARDNASLLKFLTEKK